MMIDLQHVQKRGENYRYRRKLKPGLWAEVGKSEIIFLAFGLRESESTDEM